MGTYRYLHKLAFLFCLSAMFSSVKADHPKTALLAEGGKSMFPIVISANADKEVKQAAADLGDYLGKISGASFAVTNGDGTTGIAVGTLDDFPGLKLDYPVKSDDPSKREEYLLRSHGGGLYLLGQTPVAARHAVWDLLYRLGYRQFFPGKHWEIIPSANKLEISVDAQERPSFYARSFFYGHGDWTGTDISRWKIKNRAGSAWPINSTTHSYDAFINARKEEFARHPEYLCAPSSTVGRKFRISNPDLRKLIVDVALETLEKHPEQEVVSVEPSDGGGWENEDEDKVFKSVTDRVITLANEVAEAVEKKYGKSKYVGLYAYAYHSKAPTIRVRSNILVGVASMYNQSGLTPEENMAAWRNQGAMVAVRDYWNVSVWNRDVPGMERISDLYDSVNRYKRYYASGVRFCLAESTNSWGPIGLPMYCLVRTMWNVNEDTKAMVDDFFAKAFGPAEKPMREFYSYIDAANRYTIAISSRQQIGGMYRTLDQAYRLTEDAGIRSRLDDLALYTRYAEMVFEKKTEDDTKKIMEFMYRIRDRHMVHSYAMWRDTRGFIMPKDIKGLEWNLPEGQHPWKNSVPFTSQEISQFIQDGISNNPVISFTPILYSENLRPVPAEMGLSGGKQRGNRVYKRDDFKAFAWFDKAGRVDLKITAGQVNRGLNPTLQAGAKLYDESNSLVSSQMVLNDLKQHDVTLESKKYGLHKLEICTGSNSASVDVQPGVPVVFPINADTFSFIDMYFYVPKGTKEVAGCAFRLCLYDSDGKIAYKPNEDKISFFSVPVPAGQDGKLWRATAYSLILMTVPPYLACSADEMLLPKEVIEADNKK